MVDPGSGNRWPARTIRQGARITAWLVSAIAITLLDVLQAVALITCGTAKRKATRVVVAVCCAIYLVTSAYNRKALTMRSR